MGACSTLLFDWAGYLSYVQSHCYDWIRLWPTDLARSASGVYPTRTECHLSFYFLRAGICRKDGGMSGLGRFPAKMCNFEQIWHRSAWFDWYVGLQERKRKYRGGLPLAVKKLRGSLRVAAVSAPGLGDQRKSWLQEIALQAGGNAIIEGIDAQLKNMRIFDLGQARKVIIDKNHTVIEDKAIYHQLCSCVPLKSSPVADSSQHGKREFSHTQLTTI